MKHNVYNCLIMSSDDEIEIEEEDEVKIQKFHEFGIDDRILKVNNLATIFLN